MSGDEEREEDGILELAKDDEFEFGFLKPNEGLATVVEGGDFAFASNSSEVGMFHT